MPDTPPAKKLRSISMRVQVRPGVWQEVSFPARAAARWGLVRLRGGSGGTLTPDLTTWTGWYRLTENPERDLGLPVSRQFLTILGLGGFIRVRRPSPAVTLIDVESLYDHLQRTEGDKAVEFWGRDNIAKWEEAIKAYRNKEHRILMEERARRQRTAKEKAAHKRPADPNQLDLFPSPPDES
jgi:hypothetical protein